MKRNIKKVIIELELAYPYRESLGTLNKFNVIWKCVLLGGGTNQEKAIISMPIDSFRQIFDVDPMVGEYEVPRRTEKFLTSLKVQKIK